MTPLAAKVIEVALSQVGVRELGRNRGKEVDEYIRSVGLNPEMGHYAWCMAFVHWCFEKAAADLGIPCPMAKTAGVLRLWDKTATPLRFKTPSPGSIFLINRGDGRGHAGLVTHLTDDGWLATVEGNTDPGGTREGDGVYRRTRRTDEVNLGYIDYGRPLELTPAPAVA